jgi:hypothetical protein
MAELETSRARVTMGELTKESPLVKVFLSYSHADSAFAQRVSEVLREAGIDVEDGISASNPGDVWAAKLGDTIASSDAVLVVVPEDPSAASWTYAELAKALQANRPVIPLITRANVQVPPLLAAFQHVDVSDADSRDEVLGHRRRGTRPSPRAARAGPGWFR